MQTTASTAPTRPAINDLIPLLRLESLAVGLGGIVAYASGAPNWPLFAILIFAPDLAMAGYAFGPRIGAVAYNATHSYIGPSLLAVLGWIFGGPMMLPLAAIWVAHIGLDRAIGYGLKHRSGFMTTHLTAPA